MSKAIVNMTPNPSDIQTIHCSQGDTEAREWEFELHNNGEVIDAGGITEQMVFKSYKGGTEQILPENGAVPVTAPFVGDIKYPDATRTDQEFLYRQSPTEEDGLAKIQTIYGNTLVWNQLVQSGSGVANNCTKSFDSSTGITTITPTSYTVDFVGLFNLVTTSNLVANHEYLISAEINPNNLFLTVAFGFGSNSVVETVSANKFTRVMSIRTWTESSLTLYGRLNTSGWESGTFQIKNVQCIDLTQMGLDISSPSEFTSLFSLPYYAYNQGTLLSFMGSGIKTVGKNLIDTSAIEQGSLDVATGNPIASSTRVRTPFIELSEGSYTITSSNGFNVVVYVFDSQQVFNASASTTSWKPTQFTFYLPFNGYVRVAFRKSDNSNITPNQINGEWMYNNNTSSTLSLPISTYFPNGMDGVPYSSSNPTIVYDELTDTKAIKRTNKVIYDGSNDENWQLQSINSYNIANFTIIIDDYVLSTMNSSKCNIFTPQVSAISQTQTEGYLLTFDKRLYIRISSSKASTVEQFRTWLASNNIEFVYRLATPTETSFTTASLVTENGEVALANENGVLVGKCNSDVSADAGFIEGKIKLSDEDGDVYSNKIQIHVERSPQ